MQTALTCILTAVFFHNTNKILSDGRVDTLNVPLATTEELLVLFEMVVVIRYIVIVNVWFFQYARQEHRQQQHLHPVHFSFHQMF